MHATCLLRMREQCSVHSSQLQQLSWQQLQQTRSPWGPPLPPQALSLHQNYLQLLVSQPLTSISQDRPSCSTFTLLLLQCLMGFAFAPYTDMRKIDVSNQLQSNLLGTPVRVASLGSRNVNNAICQSSWRDSAGTGSSCRLGSA